MRGVLHVSSDAVLASDIPHGLRALPGRGGSAPQVSSAMQSSTPTAILPCHLAWQEDHSSRTKTLTADCVTESPITIPDGWMFDGGAHTISVVDPGGSKFRGGVIDVRDRTASVRNVAIDGSGAPGCSPETLVAGVLFAGAGGSIERTTVTHVSRGQGDRCGYGIIIVGPSAAAVTVSGTTVLNPGDDGIVVTGAQAVVRDNTITDASGNGIAFGAPGTSGTIAGNTIRNAGYAGISIEEAAVVSVTGNTVVDPKQFGVIALTGASVDVTNQNRLVGGVAGIVVADPQTSATIGGNEIASSAKDGIYIQNGAEAAIANNTIIDSSGSGITVSQPGTRGTIRGNVIEDVAVSAILVRDRAEADVTGNVVHGPKSRSLDSLFGPFGIRYANGADGEIRENSISDYLSEQPGSMACGIVSP